MKQAVKLATIAALAIVVGAATLVAGIKVTVQEDKTFDFTGLRSYAWHLDDAKPIKMLQNTDDNPEQIRQLLEPIITGAVDQELAKKGFTKAPMGQADLHVDYYVLIGPGVESQYQGQFVGAVPAWGLPDFAMSTSSFKAYEQGSIVIDVVSPKEQQIVWRAVGAAAIDRTRTMAQRTKIIGDGIAQMLKKFPPKFKKQ